MGTAATAAGYGWSALLVAWFVVSSAFTRLGLTRKAQRTADALADASARRAVQVFANGGVFALAALAFTLSGEAMLGIAALGALAAAAADTWATEIGTLWGGTPHSLLGGAVSPGMSGGITGVGLLASASGALAVAIAGTPLLASAFISWDVALPAIASAGAVGSLVDSLLGATLQAKRHCASCGRLTERDPHSCGTRTTPARGLPWMTNDTVNFLATLAGALVAVALA